MKRIFGNGSYANVTATLALVIALGGTSYAAVKLPRNSVTSATVKDRSLLKKDFKTGQLPAGKRGPAGPAGPPGSAGSAGAGGAGGAGGGAGAAVVNRAEGVDPLVPGTGDQTIQSMNLPGGNWAITAKFVAENGGLTGFLRCSLMLGGAVIDTLGPGNGVDFDQGAAMNTLTGAGSFGGGAASIVCNTSNSVTAGSYRARSMTAVQTGSVGAG